MEAGTQLAAVVEALDAAMSITSSSDIRKNATAFLEQVGDCSGLFALVVR